MRLINEVVLGETAQRLPGIAAEVARREQQVAAALAAHPRLRRLLEHLERQPSHQLTTAAAAKFVCFQMNYFCTLFKRETGDTFVSWQRAWRVVRIAQVLLSENISITRAAERYGYVNMRAFERAFKAVFQVSAREFRREYRSKQLATGASNMALRRQEQDMENHIVSCNASDTYVGLDMASELESSDMVPA